MALPTETKQYTLALQPPAEVDPTKVFKLSTAPLPSLKENQVLLQTTYLSNDPAQRGWISPNRAPERLYVPPVQVGEIMRARAICKVLKSTSGNIKEGSSVVATIGWTQFGVLDAKDVTPIAAVPGLEETQFLGALGATGLTAIYGLDVVECTAKDKIVVVSGAAGATGSMVVQIAKKLIGVGKVVGIAGTADKCRWVESLGADVCINYKDGDWKGQLKAQTEGFADVYFDNVGGEILDFMLTRMARYGRVAACGAVSAYNDPAKARINTWTEIISMRIQIRGFIILDAAPKFAEYTKKLVQGYQEGKLKIGKENETIVPSKFEDIPNVWLGLYEGKNTGKLVTQLQ